MEFVKKIAFSFKLFAGITKSNKTVYLSERGSGREHERKKEREKIMNEKTKG